MALVDRYSTDRFSEITKKLGKKTCVEPLGLQWEHNKLGANSEEGFDYWLHDTLHIMRVTQDKDLDLVGTFKRQGYVEFLNTKTTTQDFADRLENRGTSILAHLFHSYSRGQTPTGNIDPRLEAEEAIVFAASSMVAADLGPTYLRESWIADAHVAEEATRKYDIKHALTAPETIRRARLLLLAIKSANRLVPKDKEEPITLDGIGV